MCAGESVGSGPDKRLVPFIASGNKIMTLLRSCTKLLHSPTTPTLPCNMQPSAAHCCLTRCKTRHFTTTIHHHFAMLNAELIYQWTVFVRCCHNAPCLPALCATGMVVPCLVPGTAASAILVPASARLQQIQPEKSAALQLQAETRKNMRRH